MQEMITPSHHGVSPLCFFMLQQVKMLFSMHHFFVAYQNLFVGNTL